MVALRLEYRVLDWRNFSTAGELEAMLNQLSDDGWSVAATSGHYITLSRVRREELVEPVAVPWVPYTEGGRQ